MPKADIDLEKLKQWQKELNEEIASLNAKVKPLMERTRVLYEKLGAVNRLLALSEGRKPETAQDSSQAEIAGFGSLASKLSDQDFTPTDAYWLPILETLAELGGAGRSEEVIERVGEKMRDILRPSDHELLPSGAAVRWRNRVAWQRFNMVKQGILKGNSPRGVWEVTEKGRAELSKRTSKSSNEVHKMGIKVG